MTSEPNPAPRLAAPRPLWRAMRAFLCVLFDLFGQPSDIAACGLLGRRSRALLMPWLRAGEAFLRRLLFIEALALTGDTSMQPARQAKRTQRTRSLHEFQPDKPEGWCVSFRLLPSTRGRRRSGGRRRRRAPRLDLPPVLLAPQPQPAQVWRTMDPQSAACSHAGSRAPRDGDSAWPVAERLEAMLRVYNAPHAAALRLARLLTRSEERALCVLRPLPVDIIDRFGAANFARCNAIVASRRRKWERAQQDTVQNE